MYWIQFQFVFAWVYILCWSKNFVLITNLSNENDIAFENVEETIGDEIFEISLDSIRRLQHHAGAVVAGATDAGPTVDVRDVGKVRMRRADAGWRVRVGAANAAGVDSLVAGAAP